MNLGLFFYIQVCKDLDGYGVCVVQPFRLSRVS
jgi:hypothetical protein